MSGLWGRCAVVASGPGNGVLAPPVILLVVLLSSDPRVMGQRVNPPLLRWLGWITLAVMSAASIGLSFTL